MLNDLVGTLHEIPESLQYPISPFAHQETQKLHPKISIEINIWKGNSIW
jgi:hypothetical protein